MLLAETDIMVLLQSEAMVPLHPIPLLDNKEFLFHLFAQTNLTLFTHLIEYETIKVLVKNISDRRLYISHR